MLHRYVSQLDEKAYEKEISIVQFTEKLNMCVQWKREVHWMKQNEIDVATEFAAKVKEMDEMLEKLGQNNKLEYMKVLNDLIKRKQHSKKFYKKGKGFQFKKLM